MKLATFRNRSGLGAGIVEGGEIVVCAQGAGAATAILDLIESGEQAISQWQAKASKGDTERLPLSEVELEAPLPSLRQSILCVGKNYRAHATEFHSSGFDSSSKEEVPSAPVIFAKAGTSVIGPGKPVKASLDPTGSVDYEGELGVIIGRKAFGVAKDDAYDHVFGYTIINDVTSRELQKRHGQWLIGKSLDTFGPMGPTIVTRDEIGDIAQVEVVTEVNGEVRQRAFVRDLIFDIPTLISTLSATQTLMPGDIIATGTPAGVGIGFSPPKYLKPGDVVSVTIEPIGTLINPIA